MGIEIERKFRVRNEEWRKDAQGVLYRQGYLNSRKERTVRVRLSGGRGFLTVKGISRGAARTEFEYEIPAGDARSMLDELCEKPIIEKTRYRVAFKGHVWEIDEFHGENSGLVIAEIELSREDEPFELPPWAGQEVTTDPRYFNANLIKKPYSTW